MREIHLIRHAHAGSRREWKGDDAVRPLSERGWDQAEAIAAALADERIDRLLSSEYVRCVQTLEPLGRRLGLEVDAVDPLTEGGSGRKALDLLLERAGAGERVAACSHGDVIPAIVATALGRGAELDGPASLAKGARYVLAVKGGQVVRMTHVPPPDRD